MKSTSDHDTYGYVDLYETPQNDNVNIINRRLNTKGKMAIAYGIQ